MNYINNTIFHYYRTRLHAFRDNNDIKPGYVKILGGGVQIENCPIEDLPVTIPCEQMRDALVNIITQSPPSEEALKILDEVLSTIIDQQNFAEVRSQINYYHPLRMIVGPLNL